MTTQDMSPGDAAMAQMRTARTSSGVEIESGDWVCWQSPGSDDGYEVGKAVLNESGVLEIVWDGSGREMVGGGTLPGECSVYGAGATAEDRARAEFARLTAEDAE